MDVAPSEAPLSSKKKKKRRKRRKQEDTTGEQRENEDLDQEGELVIKKEKKDNKFGEVKDFTFQSLTLHF